MASDAEQPVKAQSRIGADLIIPVAAILLVIYYVSTIINSVWTAQVTAFIVGTLLVVTAGIYIFLSLVALAKGDGTFSLRDLVDPIDSLSVKIVLFILTLGSIFLMPILGFTLTAIVFLAASMLLLTGGRTPILIGCLSIVLSVIWFIIFVLVFQRRFPIGWLDEQIKAVVLPLLKTMGLG